MQDKITNSEDNIDKSPLQGTVGVSDNFELSLKERWDLVLNSFGSIENAERCIELANQGMQIL